MALALLSLLVGALAAGLRLGLDAWNRVGATATTIDQNTATRDALQRTIASAYPMFVMSDPMHGHVEFSGKPDELGFLGAMPASLGHGGRARIKISLDHGDGEAAVTISVAPELGEDMETAAEQTVLFSDVEGLAFSYLDDASLGQWSDVWSPTTYLPKLIRMRVLLKANDPRRFEELIVRPSIDTDVGCVYDTLTRRCRGR